MIYRRPEERSRETSHRARSKRLTTVAVFALMAALLTIGFGSAQASTQLEFGFLAKWGELGSHLDDNGFNSPHGVTVDASGDVYVVDASNERIKKYDSDGNLLDIRGGRCRVEDWGIDGCDGQFYGPMGIALSPDGDIYVSDAGNGRIQKFDSEGGFLDKWGSLCKVADEGINGCDGMFYGAYDAAVSPEGDVYVADTFNSRIQKFDSEGNFITKWGRECSVSDQVDPSACDGLFDHPPGVAVSSEGDVFVTDYYNSRVQKFDSDGGFLGKWGSFCDIAVEGDDGCDGDFYGAGAIAFSPDGEIYVTGSSRVQKFTSDGDFITKWGGFCNVRTEGLEGCDGKFWTSFGIAAGPFGNVYVADLWNHRVLKFGEIPPSQPQPAPRPGPHSSAETPPPSSLALPADQSAVARPELLDGMKQPRLGDWAHDRTSTKRFPL